MEEAGFSEHTLFLSAPHIRYLCDCQAGVRPALICYVAARQQAGVMRIQWRNVEEVVQCESEHKARGNVFVKPDWAHISV